MALSSGTQRPAISDPTYDFGLQKGSTIIYQGGLIMVDTSGFLRPAAAGVAGAYCVGWYDDPHADLDRSDATGLADGVKTPSFRMGCAGFLNDGTNPILSTTQPGTVLFAVDDQTLSLSSLGGTRPIAGRLRGLDATAKGGPVLLEVSKSIGKQFFDQQMGVEMVGAALAIASNTIAPIVGIHHVGAGLIKTITVPAQFASNGGTFIAWPDAAFTYDATGNILLPVGGGTAVINRVMSFTWDPTAAKWAPSY